MQDNFVSYWEKISQERKQERIAREQRAEQIEYLRRTFHTAVDASAQVCKQSAPEPSIVFDSIGLLTAGNLLEAIKSVVSIIDTANGLCDKKAKQIIDDEPQDNS